MYCSPDIMDRDAISMGESNSVVSAYTMYRHLQQYCSHRSISELDEILITRETFLTVDSVALECQIQINLKVEKNRVIGVITGCPKYL